MSDPIDVFVIEKHYDHEFDAIHAVYGSLESAIEAAIKVCANSFSNSFDSITVTRWAVGPSEVSAEMWRAEWELVASGKIELVVKTVPREE